MTQADLFTETPTPRQKKRGHVPRSSVAAYREHDRGGRVDAVVAWLGAQRGPVTSAELAERMALGPASLETVLNVRRGLSDAQKLGLVSHSGERKCSISGRKCVTWAVRSR
jgi:hypothetical protein